MKAKKYISVLFLSCFSVLIGHSIVPHHHHHSSFSGHECPLDQEDDHAADNHSSQCHAFNDLVLFKANLSNGMKVLSLQGFVSITCNVALTSGMFSVVPFPITVCDPPDHLAGTLSRRGPPALA